MKLDLLLDLAVHLETGKLGHETFDLGTFNDAGSKGFDARGCGQIGDAIGECPICFPNDWTFEPVWHCPVLIRLPAKPPVVEHVMEFFEIPMNAVHALFMPANDGNQRMQRYYDSEYGINQLVDTATKDEVAANIREFIRFHTK